MKTRPFPLFLSVLLVVTLLAAACGDGGTETATEEPGVTTVAPGRGWLEGDDLDWASSGADGAEESLDLAAEAPEDLASDSDSTGGDVGESATSELRAPEPLEPPIAPPIDDTPLRAGSIDDAEDVQAFLDHRTTVTDAGIVVRPLDLSDSTVFMVTGSNGLPLLDAQLEFREPGADLQASAPVLTLRTTADGTVRFSPHAMAQLWDSLEVVVRVGDTTTPVGFERGEAVVAVVADVPGGLDGSVPLDVHFVLDATGSMGDEIARLRENMTAIAEQIDALPSAPDVRFGMTVYRDEGDLFVTRNFDLTGDLGEFLSALADVEADGGGDYPEALDEALADALEKPAWRRDGAVRLMFVIADAPPQVDRQVERPYTETAVAAAAAGVKIFPVAASGTDDQAEYVMRDLAFMTGGRFVFLSYGVGGAATGERTDISADDYDELPLDQLVVRLVEDELAALTGTAGQTSTTTTTMPVTTTTFEQ